MYNNTGGVLVLNNHIKSKFIYIVFHPIHSSEQPSYDKITLHWGYHNIRNIYNYSTNHLNR